MKTFVAVLLFAYMCGAFAQSQTDASDLARKMYEQLAKNTNSYKNLKAMYGTITDQSENDIIFTVLNYEDNSQNLLENLTEWLAFYAALKDPNDISLAKKHLRQVCKKAIDQLPYYLALTNKKLNELNSKGLENDVFDFRNYLEDAIELTNKCEPF